MKKLFILSIAAYIFALTGQIAHAEQLAGASAKFSFVSVQAPVDNRVEVLREYLTERNSPLADHADVFVREADANGIDWKLLVAISGVESGYGIQIPAYSYNAWGWGIYGDQVKGFTSWEDAIHTISKGLKENYIAKGATTIYSIGRIYAASPTWAYRVSNNMSSISAFETSTKNAHLSISL